MRQYRRFIRVGAGVLAKILVMPLRFCVERVLRCLSLRILVAYSNAYGDHLCLTPLLRYWANAERVRRIIVLTNRDDIYRNNPHVDELLATSSLPGWARRAAVCITELLHCRVIVRAFGSPLLESSHPKRWLYGLESRGHFSRIVARDVLPTTSSSLPEIYFSEEEEATFNQKFTLPPAFYLIHPDTRTTFAPLKVWRWSNFEVVVAESPTPGWIQTGPPGFRRLKGVTSFIETHSVRELAWIVRNASLVLAHEGLLNHLAAAFGVRAIIIHSGITTPQAFAYPTSTLLSTSKDLSCAPCGERYQCPLGEPRCISRLTPRVVVDAIVHSQNRGYTSSLSREEGLTGILLKGVSGGISPCSTALSAGAITSA